MFDGVSLVTVTYGRRASLCVETVRRAIASGVSHVVVVCNGMAADQVSAITSALVGAPVPVTVHELDHNYGSAGGYAQGLALAAPVSRQVLLLDDDNAVEPEFLAEMLALKASVDDETGLDNAVCGFRLVDRFHAAVAQGSRDPYPPAGSFMYGDLVQYLRFRRGTVPPAAAPPHAIPYAPYGGLLVSSDQIRAVGLPAVRFVLYEDDTEYSSRFAGRAGIYLCPGARITDADGKWSEAAAGRSGSGPGRLVTSNSPTRLYYGVRNRVLFDRSRAGGPLAVRARFWVNAACFIAFVTVLGVVRRRWGALRTLLLAFVDGLAGRTPERSFGDGLQVRMMPATPALSRSRDGGIAVWGGAVR